MVSAERHGRSAAAADTAAAAAAAAGVRQRSAIVGQPVVRDLAGHQERKRFGVRRLYGLRSARKGKRPRFSVVLAVLLSST